jgi:hypothetical protein
VNLKLAAIVRQDAPRRRLSCGTHGQPAFFEVGRPLAQV